MLGERGVEALDVRGRVTARGRDKQMFGELWRARERMNWSRSGLSGSIEKPPPPSVMIWRTGTPRAYPAASAGLAATLPPFRRASRDAPVTPLVRLWLEGEMLGRLAATAWVLGRYLDDDEREPVGVAGGHLDQSPVLSFGLGVCRDALLGEALMGRVDVADL
jgi:hypothetical protein